MQVVVAGALIAGSALLVAQRQRPPELAGLWELPGGKVAVVEFSVRFTPMMLEAEVAMIAIP